MISYALGDAGTGMAANQLGTYLFFFFTCAAGLPAIAAGALLMGAKVWDAINDPAIGWLSDHTRSKWGPRLPWMISAAAPLGISLAAIWWVPPGGMSIKIAYYVIITILLMTAFTSVNLPFSALATEITEETSVRTRLNAARFTGSILSSLLGLIIAAILLSSGHDNNSYLIMGKLTGTIATVTTLIACLGLAPFARRARRPSGNSEPLFKQINRIIKNALFHKIIYLYLLLWCGLQLMQTAAIIYLQQVAKVPSGISYWMLIPFQISALIGLQFWSLYSNKFGRIKALSKGGRIWITACLITICLPPLSSNFSINIFDNNLLEIIKFALLSLTILTIGFGASTAYLIPWSLLPDAIDADPDQPAGIYTAWMVFIQKIGIGISVCLFGTLLTLSGFKSNIECISIANYIEQPASALMTIRICMGLIPSLLVASGIVLMKDWDYKHPKNQAMNS